LRAAIFADIEAHRAGQSNGAMFKRCNEDSREQEQAQNDKLFCVSLKARTK
jgi:hypothetical protein